MEFLRPPRGWNSYDCYGSTVTEDEVLANAAFVRDHLLDYGWEYIVVDYCWSHPHPPACANPHQAPDNQPLLCIDSNHRLQPAPARFPSSAGGYGFKPLADKIHAMGLKFGIHVMRGIPRQATYPGYPAEDTRIDPNQIADEDSTCSWLNHMYGLKPSSESQRYYDDLLNLYASWEVDFLKIDDMCCPYHEWEVEAVDLARQRTGRDIVLSLSPGPCPLDRAEHVARHANMWRVCADLWDSWPKILRCFDLCAEWAPHRQQGHWPDADMLPLGRLSKRGPVGAEHDSYLSLVEQRTMMTLWTIFGSPLFMGGHLPETNASTLNLLQNRAVLKVQEKTSGGRQLMNDSGSVAWKAGAHDGSVYLALFNLTDSPKEVSLDREKIGLKEGSFNTRELWKDTYKEGRDTLSAELPAHGSALFHLTQAGAI